MKPVSKEALAELDPDLLFADGFDRALLGTVERCGQDPCALYCYETCLAILMKDGLSYEEAVEHFEFNVIGAYVGDRTPFFLRRPEAA